MKGKVFTAQEVQAILAGNKTMFREVIKRQPCDDLKNGNIKHNKNHNSFYFENGKDLFNFGKCPYKVGQRIFVKEVFCKSIFGKAIYKDEEKEIRGFGGKEVVIKWKPAQHMKQEHSRLTLLIKEIRVEKLADISEENAKKEGMFFTDYGKKCYHNGYQDITKCPSTVGHDNQENGWNWKENKSPSECLGSAYWAFANYWNATHKKPEEKFEASPWVWCVEFEIVNK